MNVLARPILAAEDDENDRLILKLAFERAKLPNPLVTVRDGQECVDYLSGVGRYADHAQLTLPALLILDLKMPRMHGFEVLEWLGGRADLKELPVAILSSSSDEGDMQRARQLGACDYFVKPAALPDLVKILQRIRERWLETEGW